MADYLGCQDKSQIKKIFLVHGEYVAQSAYKNTLEQRGFRNIEIPVAGDESDL
jgi:metallo-beta-lactamase family protein